MTCARCDRVITAEHAIYSPKSGAHYCAPKEWPKCDRIHAKKKAAA